MLTIYAKRLRSHRSADGDENRYCENRGSTKVRGKTLIKIRLGTGELKAPSNGPRKPVPKNKWQMGRNATQKTVCGV